MTDRYADILAALEAQAKGGSAEFIRKKTPSAPARMEPLQ